MILRWLFAVVRWFRRRKPADIRGWHSTERRQMMVKDGDL